MQFQSPKLNFSWVTPVLIILVLIGATIVKVLAPLSISKYVVLLLNLVGTVLLATAFEPQIPLHGKGKWDSIKSAVRDFPKYGSPPAFDLLRFYVGLILLLIGIVSAVTL